MVPLAEDRMKTPAAVLTALAIVGASPAAHAIAWADPTATHVVHEDYVIVIHDEDHGREHVLVAARLTPASPRLQLALPTPGTPTIEALPKLDPAAAVHALIEPFERRTRGRSPAPPARWATNGVTLSGFVVTDTSTEKPFDPAWMKSYAQDHFSFAALDVVVPEDGRLEIVTPVAMVSFAADRPMVPRREPARQMPDEVEDTRGPAMPLEVTVVRAEPKAVAPSAEAIARVLRVRSGRLLGCYERFLEQMPGEAVKLTVDATIRPKGDAASVTSPAEKLDAATSTLAKCIVGLLRARQFPRTDEGWRFSAELSLRPPRTPARRTHLVVLGPSRSVWRSPPSSARLLHDVEVSLADVDRAFGPELRRALGLPEGRRLWLAHWLDRDERRANAEDARFDLEPLPPDGGPGTLGARVAPSPEARPAPATPVRRTRARPGRSMKLAVVSSIAALIVGLALWLARDADARP